MKKVLFVTYHFPPDARVGALRGQKLVKYLPEFGWCPEVLTVRENCYEDLDPSRLPDVAHASVWRTRVVPDPLETMAKIRSDSLAWIRRTVFGRDAAAPARSGANGRPDDEARGALRRAIISLCHMPDRHIGWLPFGVTRGLQICRSQPIAAIMTSGPPHTCHLIGLLLKWYTGIPFVADFRDPWVGNAFKPASSRSVLSDRLDVTMESAVVRRADRVVLVSDRHRQQMVKAHPGEASGKFVTVPNGFDPVDFRSDEPIERDEAFTVAHVGTIYGLRSADACLLAISRLIDEGQIPASNIRVRFVGTIDEEERVQAIVAEHDLAKVVEFTGAVAYGEALQAMRRADLLLLLAQHQPEQIPLKAFEYLGVGAPILAITGEGSTADLVRGAGGWVSPDNPDRIGAAILECYLRYSAGRRGRDLMDPSPRRDVASFERRNLAKRLAATLEDASRR